MRLHKCAGWYESSLGVYVQWYVCFHCGSWGVLSGLYFEILSQDLTTALCGRVNPGSICVFLLLLFQNFYWFLYCFVSWQVWIIGVLLWCFMEVKDITKTRLFKYIENFTTKKPERFQIKKLWYFSYFCSKHRLWVLVRTASARRF